MILAGMGNTPNCDKGKDCDKGLAIDYFLSLSLQAGNVLFK